MAEDFAPDGVTRFLTVVDTAEILNVEASDVLALVTSNELPAIRVGEQWRIEREVLESYIAALYEESRRHALWEQSEFASIPELSGGAIVRPAAPGV